MSPIALQLLAATFTMTSSTPFSPLPPAPAPPVRTQAAAPAPRIPFKLATTQITGLRREARAVGSTSPRAVSWHICRSYCKVVRLRVGARWLHTQSKQIASVKYLDPPKPIKLTWKRTKLRREINRLRRELRSLRTHAAAPYSARIPHWNDWLCIHHYEGSWQDTGDPYWGGLQMDRTFMYGYGSDMIRRHNGGLANTWTPLEQITVANRAYVTRGFTPWPNTARFCGLL